MPKVITKSFNVYEFDELLPAARKRAISKHRDFLSEVWDSELTVEDAKQCLSFAGFNITRVYYSGFWSQGDGACFEGSWSAARVNAAAMKEHAPQDTELHRIAERLAVIAKEHPTAAFSVKHSGHYYHQYCTDFSFDVTDDNDNDIVLPEDDMMELARDAMQWIYRQLERDYEWQTAEEQVIESIRMNEYVFLDSGEIAKV